MGIQNVSEDTLLVELPPKEPRIANELRRVNELVSNKDNCNVIVDFSKVEIVSSASISNLMILREMLSGSGHQLVLCSVSLPVKGVFTVTGLEASFDFTDNKSTALESIGRAKHPAYSRSTDNPEPA
ncbi:MAG: STAS domain-containing protein [Planctomycetota bacterium]|jgi:anti-anti-sigma factor